MWMNVFLSQGRYKGHATSIDFVFWNHGWLGHWGSMSVSTALPWTTLSISCGNRAHGGVIKVFLLHKLCTSVPPPLWKEAPKSANLTPVAERSEMLQIFWSPACPPLWKEASKSANWTTVAERSEMLWICWSYVDPTFVWAIWPVQGAASNCACPVSLLCRSGST